MRKTVDLQLAAMSVKLSIREKRRIERLSPEMQLSPSALARVLLKEALDARGVPYEEAV